MKIMRFIFPAVAVVVATVASFTTNASNRVLTTVTVNKAGTPCSADGTCTLGGNAVCQVSSTQAVELFTPGTPQATCSAYTEFGTYVGD
jgi:hypothetical protein